MLKLEEVFEDQGLLDFERNLKGIIGNTPPFQYTVEPKIGGIPVIMQYQGGALAAAATRGDGYVGELVTANLKTILSVPLTLRGLGEGRPVPDFLEVWGEVYMEVKDFEALNRDRIESNEIVFSSPKAAAGDSIRQSNPRMTARRPLNLFCFGVGEFSGPPLSTHYELMIHLQQWGFRVNRPHLRVCQNIEEVIERCHQLVEMRTQFPCEIDGAVVKVNQLDIQAKLANPTNPPQWSIAYKIGRPEGRGGSKGQRGRGYEQYQGSDHH